MDSSGLKNLLNNPFVGFAPWIVMSVITGPSRLVLATAVALGLSLLATVLGLAVGMSPKMLDIAGLLFFGALLVVALVASGDTLEWLERWSGELSNVVILAIAAGSMVIRRPFTLQYARESVPRELWNTQGFMHTNYVITFAWVLAFVVQAVCGWIADGPMDEPNNAWVGWIIPIAAIVLAIRFTDWYPDVVRARAGIGDAGPPPTVADLFLPLAGYLVPVGIIVLIIGGTPWWVGVGLIVLGSFIGKGLHSATEQESSTA